MKTTPAKALAELQTELVSLRSLDSRNQSQLTASQGRKAFLTKSQMFLLTEAVFFAAFRSYEQFLRNTFLLYCCGTQPGRRRLVRSFLQPKSLPHAEALVKSGMPFLDWSSPDNLLERAEAYLDEGYPVKTPLTANREVLREMKSLRNHIAHRSAESLLGYKKVLKSHYATMPLRIPSPGEFLLVARKMGSGYKLQEYIETIDRVARLIA